MMLAEYLRTFEDENICPPTLYRVRYRCARGSGSFGVVYDQRSIPEAWTALRQSSSEWPGRPGMYELIEVDTRDWSDRVLDTIAASEFWNSV